MRVLVVTNTFPTPSEPDGTPCIKDQMDTMQQQSDVTFDLLYIDRRNKLNYFKAAWKVFLLNFKPKKYDLIHAHYGHSAVVARLQVRYPLVVTFHGCDLQGPVEGKIGRMIAPMVKGVIVMNEDMKRVSRRSDAQVIPFGVDTRIFFPTSQQEARQTLGLPQDKKLILFPYNPNRVEKRFDIVEEVARRLEADGYPVQLLPVYGQTRETISTYMNACDVMLLASDREGSPMAVRESIACNLPVVSADVGDVRDLIEGLQGCYIARQDAGDLAEKVKLVFDAGQRSDGDKVVDRLNMGWASQRVYKIYQSVVSSMTTG